MQNKLIIGRLASTYGVQGWLKVVSFTEPANNLLQYHNWQIKHQDRWQVMQMTAGKPHGKQLVVKLEGIDNSEVARLYTNDLIAMNRSDLPALEKDEYYWTDLIGLNVVTLSGVQLGTIDHLIETGSNDVLVVKNGRQRLLPYTDDVVHSIDLHHRIMVVDWDPEF